MILTVVAQVLSIITSFFAVVAGLYGFAGFVKRWWTRPRYEEASRR